MNTRNDFLDNAVDDEVGIDGTVDLNTEMCSSTQNDIEEMCLSMSNDKYRDYCGNTKETYLEILYFKQFYRHFVFVEDEAGNRNKRVEKYFDVSVVVNVGCGNTKEYN